MLVFKSLLVLCLLVMLASLVMGCRGVQIEAGFRKTPAVGSPTSRTYLEGDVRQTVSGDDGPLHLEVWRVLFRNGSANMRGATTYIEPPGVAVYFRLENRSTSPVVLFDPGGPRDPADPTPPSRPTRGYYLMDDMGAEYPANGVGGTRYEDEVGEPDAIMYRVLPGQTRDLSLSFQGIPAATERLTLVLESVRSEDGTEYKFELQLPVPGR